MKFFRSHIARLSGFIMLMVGVALHYAKPLDAKANHSAFTNWLESHLKTPDHDVLNKLHELSAQDADLESVIRQASELIATHSDDFELPVSNDDASEQDRYELLLTEWKNYQDTGSGMGKAVLIQNIKPSSILQGDSHYMMAAISKRTSHDQKSDCSDCSDALSTSDISYILTPLESGVSINAP